MWRFARHTCAMRFRLMELGHRRRPRRRPREARALKQMRISPSFEGKLETWKKISLCDRSHEGSGVVQQCRKIVFLLAIFCPMEYSALAQSQLVWVYSTHFEAGGKRFESGEELRKYLVDAATEFTGVSIRECNANADARAPEAQKMVLEALYKRHRQENGQSFPVQIAIHRIPCPPTVH
jgi:hypothetical protein